MQIPDPGCFRILDDEVSSVLQLISRDACHELNHRDVALSLFPRPSVGLVGCSA